MDLITNRLLRQAIPLFQALAGVLLVLALAALLKFGEEVIVHLVLGILLSFALSPVMGWLRRRGLDRRLALLSSILLAVGLIVGLAWVAYWQASVFAADVPGYEPVLQQKIASLSHMMAGRGVFSDAADVLTRVFGTMQQATESAVASSAAAVPVVRIDDDAHGFQALYAVLVPLLAPLGSLFVVILLASFMLAERSGLRNRFIRLTGTEDLQKTTAALDDAGLRVGRMLLTQLAVNGSFGLTIGIALWAIGLPSPFLWGIFAGIMRFVPYVGAFIGLVPPLFVAFAVDPGWHSVFWTLGLFALVEPLVGHVIEPLLYGQRSGLSPVAIIVAATIWAYLWGPIGLVLSTPLTICLVVLGRHVQRLQFLDTLLGDRPVLAPHEIFYQRMLAGDPQEAREQALEFLKGRSLSTYYDDIALAAVRRAHQDIVRGSVSGDRLDRLIESAQQVVAGLADAPDPLARGGQAGVEAQAAFDQVRLERDADRRVFEPSELARGWRGETPVAVLHGDHPLDGLVAAMLAQLLTKHGLRAAALPLSDAAQAPVERMQQVALVCLSFVEPLSTLHLRSVSLQVRQAVPKARVMLCIWQQTDAQLVAQLRAKLRVETVATTTSEALEAAGRIATGNRAS